jgi:glutamate-1-semialdehyde 2,1-aminomutase
MNEFLRRIEAPAMQASAAAADALWNERAAWLNERLTAQALPVRIAHLGSVWTVLYTLPSRYNWMLQYYLRVHGLRLSWVGTGRLIFSHSFTHGDFEAVADRFLTAVRTMRADGWWWQSPALTNAWIRRQVAWELLAAGASQLGRSLGHAARSLTIGSKRSPRRTWTGAL